MAIDKSHKANFDTLLAAAGNGDLALMECKNAKTGAPVVALCAVDRDGGDFVFVPLAKLFDGNPYEELVPPNFEEA